MNPDSLADIFQTAQRHFAAGELSQTEILCRSILTQNPYEPDALHMLGVIADRADKKEEAVRLFTRSAHFSPTAGVYLDLGTFLRRHGVVKTKCRKPISKP